MELFLKMLILLLTNIVNASNHTKCVSLSNQKCELDKLDRCVGSCNTLNDLCNKACVPNRSEDLNILAFNMITGKNESIIVIKGIPFECKYTYFGRKCNSNQKRNNDK